jgi:hypothetical protein
MKRVATKCCLALAVGSLMLTGCGTNQGPAAQETVIMHPSYPKAFQTLGELKKDATAVMVGTVQDVTPGDSQGEIPFTNVTLKVSTWIKGQDPGSDQIVVQQTGGAKDNKVFEIEDDPLMVKGAKELVFLQQGTDGKYFTIGGPAGRIKIKGDLPEKLKGSPVTEKLPATEASLVARVRALNIP